MAEESSAVEYGLLHLIGSDRIGILQDASAFVAERGGTVEQGISHALGTEAVVLLYVSGQPLQIGRIQRDTARFGETLNLLPLFTRIENPEAATHGDALPLTLRVSSPDFAGLMKVMTGLFTKHGLRIVGHHTHKSAPPFSDGMITYRHRFTVLLSPEFNRKGFIAELDELARVANFIRDDISHSDFY
jgi:glycine cleavage system regulatory protein